LQIEGFPNLDSAWVSLDEFIARADGKKNAWLIPVPASTLVSPEIYLDRASVVADYAETVLSGDGKPVTAVGPDGTTQPVVVKSGWRLDVDEKKDEATLYLDKVPRYGTRVSFGAVGRGDAEGILSFSIRSLDAELRETSAILSAKAFRKMAATKDPGKMEVAELTKYGKTVVGMFLLDWSGIKDDKGQPVPFNDVSLEEFCQKWKLPIWEFARWIVKRSGDIAVAEFGVLEGAAKN